MSAQHYIKINCPLCDGSVEFPARGLGQIIICPHCEQNIKLAEKYPLQRFLNPFVLHFSELQTWAKICLVILALFLSAAAVSNYQDYKAEQLRREQAAQAAAVNPWHPPAGDEVIQPAPVQQSATAFLDDPLKPDTFDQVANAEQRRLKSIQQMNDFLNSERQANEQKRQHDEIVSQLSDANDIARDAAWQRQMDANRAYWQNQSAQQQFYFQNQQAVDDLNTLTRIKQDEYINQTLNPPH